MPHKVLDADENQANAINKAHEEAKKILKRCIVRVEEVELGKKESDELISKYFGSPSLKNGALEKKEIGKVAENFRSIHKGLLDVTYEYESNSIHTLLGAPEYAAMKNSWKEILYGKSIHLTSIFFDIPVLQPYVLIHGASHVFAGTDDFESWENPEKFAALAPARKRENAYHYDAFAWELVMGSDLAQ